MVMEYRQKSCLFLIPFGKFIWIFFLKVQKAYLDKENSAQLLTNSDYQVHELCQQFDYVFLFGLVLFITTYCLTRSYFKNKIYRLKEPDEAYWKVILEFTHRNVIADLNNLLNVTTNFGKGRAWLYHALNDNLMESYLRCFLDNKKLVNRFYKKDSSLIGDDQVRLFQIKTKCEAYNNEN